MPNELTDVVRAVADATGSRLGIHCHDDTACGVANTLVAVDAGVTHVQGTANGYGERAGNANLFSVVAGLQLKKGRPVLSGEGIREMSRIAHAISEVTNVAPDTHQPYVGLSAFAHKAGLHASAIKVDPMLTSTSIPPWSETTCGCWSRTWQAARRSSSKGCELGYDLSGDKEPTAGSPTGLRTWRPAATPSRPPTPRSSCCSATNSASGTKYFAVESWRVIVERHPDHRMTSEATVRLVAKGSGRSRSARATAR